MLFETAPTHAEDWSLTTADFQTQPAQLKSFSNDGVQFTSPDTKTDRTLGLDQFVSLQRPATEPAPTPKYILLMTGGDRLAGEPAGVTGEKLNWSNPLLGKIPVAFSRLVMISKADAAAAMAEAPKQDLVTLANGDTAAGVFTGIDNGNVLLQTDAGQTSLPLTSVNRIAFASTGSPKKSDARAFRIHLTDGSIFTVADAVTDGDQINLTLSGKNAPVIALPLENILEIEQINGPVCWISSLTPSANIQTPYLPGEPAWPARFDLAVDGRPLSFEGQTFDRGIGVHAFSRLTFNIDPQWTTFRTQYAIESHRDDPAKYADVNVRIKLDGKTVHEQQHFKSGEISPVISLDLDGAATLTLECDYGDAGDTQAQLNWLQPALLRQMRSAAPPVAVPPVIAPSPIAPPAQ